MATPPQVRHVALLTPKRWPAASEVGFHHLARAFARAGARVSFVTVPASRLAGWAAGRRAPPSPAPSAAGADADPADAGVEALAWRTTWHPANLRHPALNRLAAPLFRRYPRLSPRALAAAVAGADLLLFDSGAGLMLVDRVRALAPHARLVYRVSDDLRHAGVHPVILEAEAGAAPRMDLVSSPCQAIHARFAHLGAARLDHHGVDRARLDRPGESPYAGRPGRHAVFVGRHFLDHEALAALCAGAPGWTVHVVGPHPGLSPRPNLRAYGELPFAATAPFIRHADAGLHTIRRVPGAEALTDTLKVMQYTYCRLPILAPAFLRSARPNVFAYEPGDGDSLARALDAAARFDRAALDVRAIRSWDELAAALAG